MDIVPGKQNIDSLFSNISYYIDFYQREYKWNKEPVERLLDDIFYKFNIEYANKEKLALTPSQEVITAYFPWYYLNTYITNIIDGKVYVVDGQQRLTTLTLISIKLYQLCKVFKSDYEPWMERKIVGYAGPQKTFWMNHVKHLQTLQDLFDGKKELKEIKTDTGITAVNLVENYQIISKWLDNELKDKNKLEMFIFYFLYRLVLVNLSVEQTNVPMVFEVINDRGVKLEPFEILKGKLLGQVDKFDLENLHLNELWEAQTDHVESVSKKESNINFFFFSFIRGKYTRIKADFLKINEENYHRVIFTDDFDQSLKLKGNPAGVKNFLLNEFKYYSNLYRKVCDSYYEFNETQPFVYFNSLNGRDYQFTIIISACNLNDPEEDKKIYEVSKEIDRMFTLLQIQSAYDSNIINDYEQQIALEIRDAKIEDYRGIFDKYILSIITTRKSKETEDVFSYKYFREIGYDLNKRFLRYFFARIEYFFSENLNLKMKHSFEDLVTKTGASNGFHIEHVLSDNDENLALFNDDEDIFYRERNRLGGLLLLKGKDNISSNNEVYKKKLKSYANTLYWNETLREDAYKSKLDMNALIKKYKLKLEHHDEFGPTELELRHKLLFDIIQIIWK